MPVLYSFYRHREPAGAAGHRAHQSLLSYFPFALLRLLARDAAAADFLAAAVLAPAALFAPLLKIWSHPSANFSVEPVCTV